MRRPVPSLHRAAPRRTSLRRATDEARVLAAGFRGATRSGLIRPTWPTTVVRIGANLHHWGTSPAIGFSLGVARRPDAIAVLDLDDENRPEAPFAEIDHRCDALALALIDRGVGPSSTVGLLGRNSRSFIEAIVAVSRIGANLVYLNTSWKPQQLSEVITDNGIELVIHDSEFTSLLPKGVSRLVTDEKSGIPLLASLPIHRSLPPPTRQGQHIMLTSGTSTGVPRGAGRGAAPFEAIASLIDTFPITVGSTIVFAAPLFHSWAWMHHRLATLLDCSQVVMRRPDPARILAAIAATEAETLITVPAVLRRLVNLPIRVKRRYRIDSLRCVAVSGSALPGDLALDFMDDFGDVLYNLYGSTEAAFATCATPADLRVDPQSAGRPLAGVHVEILDTDGQRLPTDSKGRVYVGSPSTFSGYTDGSDRPRVRGLVFTGDIGRLDAQGRLTVIGRADDMIVTGGEKVHPTEIERVLRDHPDLTDVAVTGRPDPVYGAVLVAHVVVHRGSSFSSEQLLDWSRDRLGPAHRPRAVVIHQSLPRNATGKLLRRSLR